MAEWPPPALRARSLARWLASALLAALLLSALDGGWRAAYGQTSPGPFLRGTPVREATPPLPALLPTPSGPSPPLAPLSGQQAVPAVASPPAAVVSPVTAGPPPSLTPGPEAPFGAPAPAGAVPPVSAAPPASPTPGRLASSGPPAPAGATPVAPAAIPPGAAAVAVPTLPGAAASRVEVPVAVAPASQPAEPSPSIVGRPEGEATRAAGSPANPSVIWPLAVALPVAFAVGWLLWRKSGR